MSWERNRPSTHIPARVKLFIRARSRETSPTGEDYCELRIPGVCRGDYKLQYDHYGEPGKDGVTESGGPQSVSNDPQHIRLVCSPCHNRHTQEQAQRGANAWKLEPERHPGLKRRG
jgi:hypothetical protein